LRILEHADCRLVIQRLICLAIDPGPPHALHDRIRVVRFECKLDAQHNRVVEIALVFSEMNIPPLPDHNFSFRINHLHANKRIRDFTRPISGIEAQGTTHGRRDPHQSFKPSQASQGGGADE